MTWDQKAVSHPEQALDGEAAGCRPGELQDWTIDRTPTSSKEKVKEEGGCLRSHFSSLSLFLALFEMYLFIHLLMYLWACFCLLVLEVQCRCRCKWKIEAKFSECSILPNREQRKQDKAHSVTGLTFQGIFFFPRSGKAGEEMHAGCLL